MVYLDNLDNHFLANRLDQLMKFLEKDEIRDPSVACTELVEVSVLPSARQASDPIIKEDLAGGAMQTYWIKTLSFFQVLLLPQSGKPIAKINPCFDQVVFDGVF